MSSAQRDEEAASMLLLLDAPGVGPRKALDLVESHGSAARVISLGRTGALRELKLVEYLADFRPVEPYIEYLRATEALGGEYVLWSEESYPSNLLDWRARPPILFYKGDLEKLSARSLALVGRVDPTEVGVDAATRFSRLCVENDITVVSGLAKGIDGASHREALRPPGGKTYAVIGHGLDFSYPAENRALYDTIPDNGAIISQFRVGQGPQKWTFPARNELMCTLALGTVIVEGKPNCGSIIQAEFSFKHGRPVFLLSRNLRTEESEWAHKLVSRGAHVVERFEHVLDHVSAVHRQAEQGSLFSGLNLDARGNGMAEESSEYAVIFDLDGVVVDTRAATARALASIASEALGEYVDPDGVSVLGAPHKILGELGVPDSYSVYKQNYDRAFESASDSVGVFDEVRKAMELWKAQGVRLAAVTAQPKRRADVMVPAEIRSLFDVFLTYNDTRGDKAVGIGKVLDRLRVSKSQAVYIGDQSRDLEAARKAGVAGVGVLWGFSSEEELRRWPYDLLLADQAALSREVSALLGVS